MALVRAVVNMANSSRPTACCLLIGFTFSFILNVFNKFYFQLNCLGHYYICFLGVITNIFKCTKILKISTLFNRFIQSIPNNPKFFIFIYNKINFK